MTASAASTSQGYRQYTRSVFQSLPTALLICSFWVCCFFYSVGYNLLMLQLAVAGPLVCLLIAGPSRLAGVIENAPVTCSVVLGAIVILCVHYNFLSISPEASYPYTWIMASIPLWFLALSVAEKPHHVAIGLVVSVFAMALVSDLRLVLYGQRAHDPLGDTNNYATLLYMALIPTTHCSLLRIWRQGPSASLYGVLLGLTGVLSLAVFATGSRAGAAILTATLVVWLLWALWHKLDWKPVIAIVLAFAVAYLVFAAFAPDLKAASLGNTSLQSGLGVRWLMLDSAMRIAADTGYVGTGLYTFSLLYPAYRAIEDQSTGGVLVHNDYVQLLVEGGPWLLIPLFVLAVATMLVLLRSFDRKQGLSLRHGCALALAAALAHATINFVFYSLVLCASLGVLSYFAFDRQTKQTQPGRGATRRGLFVWVSGIGFGLVCWLYLALDTYSFAVFSGQPSIPSAAVVRADADKALAYARFHHAINDNRSIPVLGEALLLAQKPYTDETRKATLDAFRGALQRHPWSEQARLAFIDYVVTHRVSSQYLRADEQPEQMLLDALRDMPASMDVVRQLVRFYRLTGRPDVAVDLIRGSVFPWMELLYRRDPSSYEELRSIIAALAPENSAVHEEMDAMREMLEQVERDYRPDVWFMRWRAS